MVWLVPCLSQGMSPGLISYSGQHTNSKSCCAPPFSRVWNYVQRLLFKHLFVFIWLVSIQRISVTCSYMYHYTLFLFIHYLFLWSHSLLLSPFLSPNGSPFDFHDVHLLSLFWIPLPTLSRYLPLIYEYINMYHTHEGKHTKFAF